MSRVSREKGTREACIEFYCGATALLLLAIVSANAQVASHAPTAVKAELSAKAAVSVPREQALDQPVARVNDTVLTRRDLLREMYAMFPYARQHGGGMPKSLEPEMRKGALEMIIFDELIYQEAVRRKMGISNASVAAAESSFRKQFPDAQKFTEYLKFECNGSPQVLRQRIRRSLLIEALLKTEVTDKSVVSVVEARRFYDQNPKQFERPESFAIQTISIMPPAEAGPEVRKEARKRAEDALHAAKTTKNYREFGLLAEKISDDDWHVNMGDRKSVESPQLPPQLVEAARGMKVGDVSNLLQFGPNYTLFRLNGHTPAGKVKFEEVKAKLQADLQKSKTDRLRSELNKRLRKSSKVEIL